MLLESIIYIIVLIALLIGTYTDFKVREVPDWLSYGLIFLGFGIRIIFSIVYSDYSIFLHGVYGFAAFLIIGFGMFYTGQWGGGDSKLIMGLGSLIGLTLSINTFLLGFFINVIIFGALFGLAYSVFMAFTKPKRFFKDFKKNFTTYKRQKQISWAVSILFIVISFFVQYYMRIPLLILALIVLFSFHVFIYLRAVETAVMIVQVPPEKLTEGDWIFKDVVVGKKRICGPKDLGIEKAQIKKLLALKRQGKIKKVWVKNGIPFVPGFLIAYIMTYFFGNFLFSFLGF